MDEIRLALIGFGNVAQGLAQILADDGETFARQYGLHFIITAIADPVRGSAFNADGLDPAALLDLVRTTGSVKGMDPGSPEWDAMEMIQNSPAEVVVEMSFTNLKTGEPATSYISEALRRKKHVITTNKGPIALHYDALEKLANQHGVRIGVEGTVMSGTPVLKVGTNFLCASRIRRIQGILNGTSNYILTRMEEGKSYTEALAEAQAKGYAEADPTGDVEGFDTAAKVTILARLVMEKAVPFEEVEREGITRLTEADLERARKENLHWKLVGSLELEGNQIKASVRPECLPDSHPLALISGATNAIVYSTDLLGDVIIVGPGAGPIQTGYAVIQDLLSIYR